MVRRKAIELHHVRGRRIALGVDPALQRCGMAAWDMDRQEFTAFQTRPFWEADLAVRLFRRECTRLKVYVEDSSRLPFVYDRVINRWRKRIAADQIKKELAVLTRQAMNIGENHAVSKLLIARWTDLGIFVEPIRPSQKKLRAEDFARMTRCQLSTNEHERDAGMLVYGM